MNTDLIIKYKSAFDWWLDNPKRCCWLLISGNWEKYSSPFHRWSESQLSTIKNMVIDDDFSRFRMAEAEGIKIELLFNNTWAFKMPGTSFLRPIGCYRLEGECAYTLKQVVSAGEEAHVRHECLEDLLEILRGNK